MGLCNKKKSSPTEALNFDVVKARLIYISHMRLFSPLTEALNF
jgi:hypothetical protein